jgi:hypothetical protein
VAGEANGCPIGELLRRSHNIRVEIGAEKLAVRHPKVPNYVALLTLPLAVRDFNRRFDYGDFPGLLAADPADAA